MQKIKLLSIIMCSMLTGCMTVNTLLGTDPATLSGIPMKNCQSFATCHYALVRKVDGANAKLLTQQTAPDDSIATRLPTSPMPAGRHTVEVVYRCFNMPTENAAMFQLVFDKKQYYQIKLLQNKKCLPVISDPNGKLTYPLITYLAD